jgi:murein DD-endopeptidase MepM/ murein hydrolase activator NlpD
MPAFCAIPPVDLSVAHVGRGNGNGWNRLHTRADQYHAGLDFMAGRGSPIIAVAPGRVAAIGSDANRTAAGGLRGYGNCVVIETRGNVPGMPNPFYTLYAHMGAAPLVSVGQSVQAGTPLGFVGSTTNGQFATMGPHLHLEFRRRPYPSSYDHDTIDPEIFFTGVGIDWTGWHREAERKVGGTLQVRVGGPSDCRGGATSSLSGFGVVYGPFTSGQASPGVQYIPAAALAPNYPGTTSPGPEVDPPEYESAPSASSSSSGSSMLWVGAAVLVLAAAWKANKSGSRGLSGLGGKACDEKEARVEAFRTLLYTVPSPGGEDAWDAARARLKAKVEEAEDDCWKVVDREVQTARRKKR